MKTPSLFILLTVISFSSFAQSAKPCGKNCYNADLNKDGKIDQVLFMIGGDTTLKLKIVGVLKEPEYITVTEYANITGNFILTVMDIDDDGYLDINTQWTSSEVNGLYSRNFINDGSGKFGSKKWTSSNKPYRQ
jgi:hypothetical protein